MSNFLFTSESVSAGHPDKLADKISDAILDTALLQDSRSRVACEVMVKDDIVVLGGEITTSTEINYEKVVKGVLKDVGYSQNVKIINIIGKQSPEIFEGVYGKSDESELGAGDQGIMFGYASDETPSLVPMPIYLSHLLAAAIYDHGKGVCDFAIGPDIKTQVTVEYKDDKPVGIKSIVASSQHVESLDVEKVRKILKTIIEANGVMAKFDLSETEYHLNPAGSFTIGGPVGDCGLTGRKIIVDTYGGFGRHGGGAFSGKDPSKVDRSAAYMARNLAKNIVNLKLASRCEVQLSYAIGYHKPLSVFVDTFGTNTVSLDTIYKFINSFDLSPYGIINYLELLKQQYYPTAAFGHFGNPYTDKFKGISFSWETKMVSQQEYLDRMDQSKEV